MDAPEIDYRAELPPHRQIAAWILARIESGDLQPGQPVPSEKELVDVFGVARTTARRAIAWLREQGAIRTVAGRGPTSPSADQASGGRISTASSFSMCGLFACRGWDGA